MGTYSTGQATQDILVNAAGELAAENGFSNVPIRAVADRSGQNIGSIHYHFKSKKKLFEAVILAATRAIRENPIKDIITSFNNRLDQPEIQSAALRTIVQRTMGVTFDPEKPKWYSRIIYQAMRGNDSLRDFLENLVIQPEITAMKSFFQRIRPRCSDQEAFQLTLLIQSPIIFHADNADSILAFMRTKRYSQEYLTNLENMIVYQAQMLLNLPPDREAPFPLFKKQAE